MAEYKKPCSEEEFDENFKQKKPVMNKTEAFFESSRCLFCYDAPCLTACPTSIDIPLFIKQINSGNEVGAAKTIFDANWFGNACGKVCPTTELCEGSCVYTNQDVLAVQIGRLQTYATSKVIESGKQLYKPGAPNGKKVAVIGAGPAGISAACELRILGFDVDVFEAKDKPSGLTVFGIAPYKITNKEVLDEMEYLQNMLGYNVSYNSPIKSKEDILSLEKNYDAIFLGVGLGSTAELNLPGEDKTNVIGAVEFIEELRMRHHETYILERVVVIGGGNTAMDAASEAARMGAKEVTLAYRRSKADMGAYDFEYKSMIGAGVDSLFDASPIGIVGNGTVQGVRFVRTKVVNEKLEHIEGSEFTIACDMVIKATGQAKMGHFLNQIEGLDLSHSKIVVNDQYQSTNPMYFAGGDAVNGGAEVVNGAHDGKAAAHGIQEWLFNK